jgi:hypothetical protein
LADRGCPERLTYDLAKDFVFSRLEDYVRPEIRDFSKMIFPVIKKVLMSGDISELLNQIVDVQPMTGPIASMFYPDFVAGRDQP